MSGKPKYILDAEERDRRAELRYQELARRGVAESAEQAVFVPAEDIDSNAEIRCPVCGGPTLYGMTRRLRVCERCDWYHFEPQRPTSNA